MASRKLFYRANTRDIEHGPITLIYDWYLDGWHMPGSRFTRNKSRAQRVALELSICADKWNKSHAQSAKGG